MNLYGLGPGIIGRLNILPYSKLFYYASKGHDIGYLKGGNKQDKKRVDNMFLKMMLSVCNNNIEILFAYFYYYSVRIFGNLFFNYNIMKENNSKRFELDRETLKRVGRNAIIIYTPVILLFLNQIEKGEFNLNLLYAGAISITVDLIRRILTDYSKK